MRFGVSSILRNLIFGNLVFRFNGCEICREMRYPIRHDAIKKIVVYIEFVPKS